MGAMSLRFDASSVLPTFPCYSYNCSTTFSGTATAASHATSSDSGYVLDPVWGFIGIVQNFGQYEVAFRATGGFKASVTYGEPSTPYCPLTGTAVGSATMTAPATGVVRRLNPPALGQVTSITVGLNFSYQRAGTAAAIVATGGYPVSVAIGYQFPDATGSFNLSAIGGGSAVFTFDPTTIPARCSSPGPLPFNVAGSLSLELY